MPYISQYFFRTFNFIYFPYNYNQSQLEPIHIYINTLKHIFITSVF